MKIIRRVAPNKGVETEYKKKLDKLVDAMSKSVLYWVLADFGDRSARELSIAIQKRIKQWKKIFGKYSDDLAIWFVKSIKKHIEFNMKNAFKEAGIKIKQDIPKNIIKAVEIENKDLINSIPEKYFIGVETVCMLALLYDWNKTDLTNELKKRYNITKRRVRIIAEDQTYKTNELFKRELCKVVGVRKGRWVYTWRSEHPRESHIQLDGALFDLNKGCYNYYDNEFIYPTQKVNCKCDFVPVIEEFGD